MKKSLLSVLLILVLVLVTGMACTGKKEEEVKKADKALKDKNYSKTDKARSKKADSEKNRRMAKKSAQKKADEAIAALQKAIAEDPENAEAHYDLGKIYLSRGKTDEAIAQFKEVISLDPENADAHYNLGVNYRFKGRTDEAIAQFKEVIALDPENADANYSLGDSYSKKDQNALAADYLHKAGILYVEKGNKRGALKAQRGLERIKADKLARDLYKRRQQEVKK